MPAEIGLSDGTKIRVEMSADDVMGEVKAMRHPDKGASSPFGNWLILGEGIHFNPAQIVYVKDVVAPTPMAAWR